MSVAARPFRREDQEDWDRIVRGSASGHFLFLRDYMDYHADRFTDASLLICEDGRPVAALPANRVGAQVVSHGGLTFGGVLAADCYREARMASTAPGFSSDEVSPALSPR